MKKKSKKVLEQKVAGAIVEHLSQQGRAAAREMEKQIKKISKILVKKFDKAIKKTDKKKKAGKSSEKKKSGPVKKAIKR